MTLVKKRSTRSALPTLRTNLSEIFDTDLFNDPFFESSLFNLNRARYSRIPATNIRETNKEFIIELAAPGMNKKDFVVDIDNGLLEIKVEKEEESEEKREKYKRKEYDYSAFYRSFNLPDSVKSDKIMAEYKDGILQVHLPKVMEAMKKPVKEIAVV